MDVTFRLNMKGVNFPFTTPEVNGTFNNWCGACNQMTDANGDSIWEAVISLPNGIHEYKFSTDNWAHQETLPQGAPCTIFTPPSYNNRKILVFNPVVLKAVCWESCDSCTTGPLGPSLQQISLPISWQDTSQVNYTTTDFGGTFSAIAPDPENSARLALKIVKGITAETWAGTTLGTGAGFPTKIPFTASAKQMQVRVFSPAAGTIFRLKAEDRTNPNISVETDAISSVANAWEILTFNFGNPVSGTPSLIFSNNYNKLSIFPNFGVSGISAGEKTYYIGDVAFGTIVKTENLLNSFVSVVPNPSDGKIEIQIQETESAGAVVSLHDLTGRILFQTPVQFSGKKAVLNLSYLSDGLYFLKVTGPGIFRQAKLEIRK